VADFKTIFLNCVNVKMPNYFRYFVFMKHRYSYNIVFIFNDNGKLKYKMRGRIKQKIITDTWVIYMYISWTTNETNEFTLSSMFDKTYSGTLS
jgi:hypothetical protein